MRFPYRNTAKDEALCCDILTTSFILVFDYKLVCEVNLSAVIFVFSNGSKLSDQVFNISVRLERNFRRRFALEIMKLDYVS